MAEGSLFAALGENSLNANPGMMTLISLGIVVGLAVTFQ